MKQKWIRLGGVKQNNLQNIHVEFPMRKITVVTGLSGSGKSSLVFDTLYAEGQRRYIESLSTYTRQFLEKMPKPDLDSVENIPPAIALEQKNHIVNSRSTVGTQTEIVDYLRVLYAKLGETYCLNCNARVQSIHAQTILEWALSWLLQNKGRKALILAPLFENSSNSSDHSLETTSQKGSTQKKAKKTKKAGSKKGTAQNSLPSLFQILSEQGFKRVLYKISPTQWKTLDLEERTQKDFEWPPEAALSQNQLFLVTDRIRVTEVDADVRGRLQDSIEQALRAGRSRIAFGDLDALEFKEFDQRFACAECGLEARPPEPNLFSFNSPVGACARCSGFGYNLEIDESLIVPDPSKTLKNGAIDPFSKPSFSDRQRDLFRFAERHDISIGKRYRELTASQKKLIWEGVGPDGVPDKTFPGILGCFKELERYKYKLHVRVFIRRYQSQMICEGCVGMRLNPSALAVKIEGKNLPQVLNLSIIDALDWFKGLKLNANQKKIAAEILTQVERRLIFLAEVGVGYLTLARLAKTLSGGEFQRISLATQLGNGLCGTLYILDEPSIGLHAMDTGRLLKVLQRLRDQGNTVVVVEHDLEVMKNADWLVELGPGAGRRGGNIVAQGETQKLIESHQTLTTRYLSGELKIERDRPPRPAPKRWIRLEGCRENNLKDINVEIPLDRFVVVTGVSGSGKSTLVHKTLHNSLSKLFYSTTDSVGKFERIYGADHVSGVVLLDQTPIGRSSRSNPATYLKAWDEVRRIYANQTLSQRRGFTPQHFSFNVDGGRCSVCKGEGEIALDMHFMAEVRIPCDECEGKRFKKNVLEVTYRGKNVYSLLQTTIDESFELFRDNLILHRKLSVLRDVGLGYLQLGQSGTTLSGGESQRLKIAATLEDRKLENLLYIFDEPTTGLHLEDTKRLIGVLQDLVDAGHSVVTIEHHLDVIASADWVVDIGPGGGVHGGNLVASCPPDKLMQIDESATAQALRAQGYPLSSLRK